MGNVPVNLKPSLTKFIAKSISISISKQTYENIYLFCLINNSIFSYNLSQKFVKFDFSGRENCMFSETEGVNIIRFFINYIFIVYLFGVKQFCYYLYFFFLSNLR